MKEQPKLDDEAKIAPRIATALRDQAPRRFPIR
jgi:hypothetical protein